MIEPTAFYSVPAYASFVAAPLEQRHTFYEDPAWRARVSDEFDSSKWVNPRWETFLVADSAAHPELVGRSVADIARERGCTPFDVVADVSLADDLESRFSVTFANDEEDGVSLLMRTDGCIMGLSDAGAHVSQICDAVMPTDFLSKWVRDRELMPVEQGVHKLTGELSDVLGIGRGHLRVGAPADVVVLDWERLTPGPISRRHDFPADGERLVADSPEGVDAVVVNGVTIREDGKSIVERLSRLPGALLQN
jgi:N-acyl-D-amino-acid deacylase